MRYLIEAELDCRYASPVREHHLQLRLAPLGDSCQRVLTCEMALDPEGFFTRHRDGFGNALDCCGIMAPHEHVLLRLGAEVQTLLENPFDYPSVPIKRERDWIRHALSEAPRLWDFVVHRSARVPDLDRLGVLPGLPALESAGSVLAHVQELMFWIGDQLDLDLTCPEALDSAESVLQARCASPADMAHLLITTVRAAGIPARFATGFVDPELVAPESSSDPGAAAVAQAPWAWAEVLIPGAGWRGFDPASGLVVNDSFVRVAVGRDAGDVRRKKESFKGDAAEVKDSLWVSVRRTGTGAGAAEPGPAWASIVN